MKECRSIALRSQVLYKCKCIYHLLHPDRDSNVCNNMSLWLCDFGQRRLFFFHIFNSKLLYVKLFLEKSRDQGVSRLQHFKVMAREYLHQLSRRKLLIFQCGPNWLPNPLIDISRPPVQIRRTCIRMLLLLNVIC